MWRWRSAFRSSRWRCGWASGACTAVHRRRPIDIPGTCDLEHAAMSHPFDWTAGYPSRRLPVFGRNVVATSHPLAAQAGLRMLLAGGNAVDAAIATAAAMTIVEPVSNGLGSDAFCLLWDGQTLHGLNASGCAPQAWTPDYFKRKCRTDPDAEPRTPP